MSQPIARRLVALRIVAVLAFAIVDAAFAQPLLTGVSQISAGGGHTCTVLTNGAVNCWGSNAYGQLGDGSSVDRVLPAGIDVGGVASAVVAGEFHTCAIVDGGLKCWGSNSFGAVGNGTSDNAQPSPVPVTGLVAGVGVERVATGYAHTCAVVEGAAFCWGLDKSGQIGNGMETPAILTPAHVDGLTSGVTDIAAGWIYSCAVVDGAAKCWGDNGAGTLGNGSYEQSSVPVQVSGLESGVTRIAAHALTTCAIVNGGAKCWGGGPLGNGDGAGSNVPIDVPGLASDVVNIAVGNAFACAITSDGVAHCWGENSYGELGNGGYETDWSPIAVPLTDFDPTTWSLGDAHTCALNDGAAYCWGSNFFGQLGIGSKMVNSLLPESVQNLAAPVDAIRIGTEGACAIANGSLSCWGANNHGQLGDGTNLPRGTSQPVVGLDSGVIDVAVYAEHTCAIASGGVYCWGDNDLGQLGDGTYDTRWIPAPVSGLGQGVDAITVGLEHSCAIVDGAAKCWGWSLALGDGDEFDNMTEPVDVIGLSSGVTAIAAGAYHTCVVVSGAAKCWGGNASGQLGDAGATIDYALEPVQVVGLTSGVSAISASGSTTCAIVNGGAMCWGFNETGQLGNGTYDDSNVPVPVTGLDSGVLSITVGEWHACAMTTTGEKCWGDGTFGELGNGSTTSSNVPVDVTVAPDATFFAAGANAMCALTPGGAVCWGYNSSGQLGNGGVPWTPVPLRVADSIFADGFDG